MLQKGHLLGYSSWCLYLDYWLLFGYCILVIGYSSWLSCWSATLSSSQLTTCSLQPIAYSLYVAPARRHDNSFDFRPKVFIS